VAQCILMAAASVCFPVYHDNSKPHH